MARPSTRVGPYEVLSALGAGGMAETYVAVRRGPGTFEQRVCLKRIRRELAEDPEHVRQFLAEATIAATLRHANVAQVLDFGTADDSYYLALELVDGLDLRALLRATGGRLAPRLVVHLARELCAALDYAHRGGGPEARPGVVHRDVSPSNVLVGREGEVKLTDFGIARAPHGPQHTASGVVKGKVPYLAPEYARTGRFDARSDLYSLGVLLFECLAGRRPYEGETDLALIERASRGEHDPLAAAAPDAPPALTVLVERLVRPDPNARPSSAAAVLDTLLGIAADASARRDLGALVAQAMDARPSVAPPPASDAPPAPTEPLAASSDAVTHVARTRSRAPWITLGAALVLAAGVTGTAAWRDTVRDEAERASPSPAPPAAPMPPAPAVAAAEPAALPAPEASPPAAAPDAGTLATARLRVVVVPFGDVVVDGRPRGRAPVDVELAPGAHTVRASAAGQVLPARAVTLAAGETRTLTLR